MVSSLYWLITSSWLNILLLFVPLGFVAEFAQWPAVWRFSLNFLAIIPLAKVSLNDLTQRSVQDVMLNLSSSLLQR